MGGVVIIHGAGSQKENHFDIARKLTGIGLSAICFDQRGHGASDGPMDARIVDDAVSIAHMFEGLPIGLRGSSMGAWVALSAAKVAGAKAIVAICPTTAEQLTQGIKTGRLSFAADEKALTTQLAAGNPPPPTVPTLLLHATGDEVVPVDRSRTLAPLLTHQRSRYLEVPGGHHRSLQHDPEMVRLTGRFLLAELTNSAPSD